MSVTKVLKCKCGCRREMSQQLKPKDIPPCPQCGALDRVYDEKWTVKLALVDEMGQKYRYNKAYSVLKAEAVAHEAELIAAKSRGDRQTKDCAFTFERGATFFEAWVTSKVGEKAITDGTGKMYLSRLRCHLTDYFKGVDLRYLTETDVEMYRKSRRESASKPKPASLNREVATLKRMTSILYKRRMIQADPLAGIEMLKEDNRREQVLTPEQITAMLDECDRIAFSPRLQKNYRVYPAHLKIAVLLALNTGLRIAGVLTLKWSELDWDNRSFRKIVKGGKEVMVPMTPVLHDTLREWQDGQDGNEIYILPSPRIKGQPMLITSKIGFQRMCRAIGLDDFTFHQLRHQFATYFIAATKNIPLCSKILGHSSVTMTERYSHLIESEARVAMDNFRI
jgi:integrase